VTGSAATCFMRVAVALRDRAIEPASPLSLLELIKHDGEFQRQQAGCSINISLVWPADGGSII
jgi:hypothetical protein